MDALKLRFPGQDRDELALGVGVKGVGRDADGRFGPLDEDREPALRFCVDRRGIWLTVADEACSVHVNGRQVRRMAMLRVGDAIYVDGVEMRLVSADPPALLSTLPGDAGTTNGDGDPRVVLRGVGGQYHGRSFTLERPRLVGSAGDADIRIDDPAFADRHARIELLGDHVVLRDIASAEGSEVNGELVRDAVLRPGDQVVFDAHHRFVVEAPGRGRRLRADETGEDAAVTAAEAAQPHADNRGPSYRLPWLLLAAALLAAALSVLLLFGTG